MRILFVAPEPPNHLNRIRAQNILKALASNHEVHLLYLEDPHLGPPDLAAAPCWRATGVPQTRRHALLNCLWRLPLPEPLEAAYCYSRLLADTLREILAREAIDLVYIKRTRMARYGLGLGRWPAILDLTDSMEVHYGRTWRTVAWYRKPLFIEEWLKYRLYERRVVRQYPLCVVASPVDRDKIARRTGTSHIRVVPNIVDTAFFQPQPGPEEPNSLVFSGLMDRQVNIDGALYLLERVLPLVRREVPDARLRIVGPEPPERIKAYQSRVPNLEVTGYVPDLRRYVAHSAVVVVPIRVGAGTRNKILQALAMQKAVVSTHAGAEGLEGLSEESIRLGDTPEELARQIVSLLGDAGLRARLGQAGRRLVEERYSLAALRGALENVLHEASSNKPLAPTGRRFGDGPAVGGSLAPPGRGSG